MIISCNGKKFAFSTIGGLVKSRNPKIDDNYSTSNNVKNPNFGLFTKPLLLSNIIFSGYIVEIVKSIYGKES